MGACGGLQCKRCSGKGKIRKGKKGKMRLITCPTCDGTGLPHLLQCEKCKDRGAFEVRCDDKTKCIQGRRNKRKTLGFAQHWNCPKETCTMMIPCTHCAVMVTISPYGTGEPDKKSGLYT